MTGSGATPSGQETCGCGLNLAIWQNSWNHRPGCTMSLPAPAQEAGSGRQAAVEAVARWLWVLMGGCVPLAAFSLEQQQRIESHARDLLSLPEVAALSQPGEPT